MGTSQRARFVDVARAFLGSAHLAATGEQDAGTRHSTRTHRLNAAMGKVRADAFGHQACVSAST
ncbi:hypothetical protein AKJ09_09323 [Labilithrix luteola]|uniref:Uncharacterized protein n=1 Tax=Labilithrix luteola TaxID=1391654 RepID=A0A0K1QB72_9BACT|nr:hypothetical protein AKJ09_09323 [Labilithrix luteola]